MIWALVGLALAAPCEDATPIQAGQPAPCDGILVPSEQVRELLLTRDVELPKLQAELDLHTELTSIRMSALENQLTIERGMLTRYRELLDNPPRARVPWYEHPAFWAGVGAVAGMGVGVSLAVR